ncbi:putative thiamine biosynthetic bifunctional protein [Botrytis fragariae]|uniref:Putative thiamine biosynthetic bifunctional protein n=1 Tax=Botrytis fragariae TaxID=1964551 RepID=A0A8H6APZ7_9HELO|nr:putative thiamine biosynthetic bifunctional protein [Botrytis fragariae]KAF5871467.1 putative thiamine biosynthetic bifunctional protein [Botrytis fragariae]
MALKNVDYSLYLVTDSTPAILGDRNLVDVVDAAVRGGVTIVQYRDKYSDTAALVDTARKLHAVTRKYNVPLLINDRIDVALAVACEGVHIGQDDMDLKTARTLLGKDAIIGVTVANVQEALTASKDGADYLGIGTMFATPTKTNTKDIIGTAGTKEVLHSLQQSGSQVRTVAIGGINSSNLQRVLYQSASEGKQLDGVAIVSAIIAAQDAEKAARELAELIRTPAPFALANLPHDQKVKDLREVLLQVPGIIGDVAKKTPLSHNMTNLVVQNFAANVALAIGASPIMANYGEEAADLAKLGGGLVINMGTVTPEGIQNYSKALRAYNNAGGPIVLDPVGCGATAVRRSAVKSLLANGYFDVIKGNEGEIKTVSGSLIQQRGVDSGSSTSSLAEKATIVRDLALRERNVVLMTGAIDVLSDGVRTFAISNGHEILGRITGSGCVLGTIISAMLAVSREDKLLAVLSALLHYEIAAEIAAVREDVRGPGTFVPALIDELIATTQKLIKASDILHIPIYATTQNRARLGETCAELKIPNAVEHADKTAFSMWIPSISRHFHSATPAEVIIVGIESHICVTQTTLDLLANGHKVYVLADGVSSCNPQEIPIALDRLRAAGAIVTTSESIMYEIMGDASIPEFKAIATLVKESSASTKDVMSTLLSKM